MADGPSASFLDFLKSLMFDDSWRAEFDAAPHEFLTAQGFAATGADEVRAGLETVGIPAPETETAGETEPAEGPAFDPRVSMPPSAVLDPDPAPGDAAGADVAVPPNPELDAVVRELQGALTAFSGFDDEQREDIRLAFDAAEPSTPFETFAAVAPEDPPPDAATPEEDLDPDPPGFGAEPMQENLEEMETAGKNFFLDTADGIADGIRGIGGAMQETGADGREEYAEAEEDFAEQDYAAGTLGFVGGAIMGGVGDFGEAGVEVVGDVTGGVVRGAGDLVGGVVGGLIGLVDEGTSDTVEGYIEEGADVIAGGIETGADYVGDAVDYVAEGVGEVIEGIGEVLDEGPVGGVVAGVEAAEEFFDDLF